MKNVAKKQGAVRFPSAFGGAGRGFTTGTVRIMLSLGIVLLFTGVSSGQTKNLNIIFIGNSITYGANLDNPETEAPPVSAAAYLMKKPGIGAVAFSNQGHSGYTTVDFMPANKALANAESAAMAFTNKNALLVFSIDLGTNDSAIKGPNGSPVTPDNYRANLKAITDELLREFPACIVIIHHPIWYSKNTYNGAMYLAQGLRRLKNYFPQIDGLVADYAQNHPNHVFVGDNLAFDYFKKNYLAELTPEAGHKGTFYLHPNKKGAETLGFFWGAAIFNAVKTLP